MASTLVVLQSAAARVVVAPERGARVTSLVDLRNGREWLVQGEPPANDSDAARYGLAEAAGWDECFPTVSPCVGAVRDHGDLWGRQWSVEASAPERLATRFQTPSFAFRRELRLRGATLYAHYRVDNLTAAPRTALWAMHPLFALQPGEAIELGGVRALIPTYLNPKADLSPLPWPDGDSQTPFPFSRVQGPEARFAGKFFAADETRQARVGRPGTALALRWRGAQHVGLWLAYGAWPTPNEIVHVAIEPTTSPVDSLASVKNGPLSLPAHGRAQWTVSVTLCVA